MNCPFLRDDAAYLLGALDPEERQRYEVHLDTCAPCAHAVSGLAGIPGLLARLTPDQVAAAEGETEEPPPALLNSLVRTARRERRVSRWRVAVAAGAVAACLGVAGAGFAMRDSTPPTPAGVTLQAVGGLPVNATVSLRKEPWGTRIQMRCEYDGQYANPTAQYVLVVRDRDGESYKLDTWRVIPGHSTDVNGTTALSRTDIATVEVQTTDGTTVARGNV
ncbi:MAG TPA: zf-HC2 domain-containing protein [Mycobacteriales bacterium]|nr:zf-HC2 domain-containing protein [Mycobacteriales bacterium]